MHAMTASPDEQALAVLTDELRQSGHAWRSVAQPLALACHARRGPYLYASDDTGRAEAYLAAWLKVRLDQPCTPADLAPGHGLNDGQQRAAEMLLGAPVGCLSGLPGTGKTYTARAIAQAYAAAGCTVGGCAFTGAAASRLSESTGLQCSTIHRLLGFDGSEFTKDVPFQVLLVDEASMLSNGLGLALCSRLPKGGRVIFIGDPNQLYGTEPGRLFDALCEICPHAHLSEVMRQEADSPIGLAAAAVLAGKLPETMASPTGKGGFMYLTCDRLAISGERAPGQRERNHPLTVAERFAELEGVPMWQVRTMATSNRVVDVLNLHFERYRRDSLTPTPFMCVKNCADEGVFNGDIGLKVWSDRRGVLLQMPDGRRVRLPAGIVRSAWATTVHKAQGREATAAQMYVEGCSERRALYTAITRAKSRFALVASLDNLTKALNNVGVPRFSLLSALYRGEAQFIE